MAELDPTVERRRDQLRTATIKAIKRRKTHVDRWETLNHLDDNPLWIARAKAAAAIIPPHRRVLDLGCGAMIMEPYLPEGSVYVPLDVCRRDERTIVVDLNRKPLPPVPADFLLGMGVLEYLFDLPAFLMQAAAQFDEALVSYHPLERSLVRDRLALGWVNALNSAELIALFRHAGFRHVAVTEYAPTLHFYRLSKDAPAPPQDD